MFFGSKIYNENDFYKYFCKDSVQNLTDKNNSDNES